MSYWTAIRVGFCWIILCIGLASTASADIQCFDLEARCEVFDSSVTLSWAPPETTAELDHYKAEISWDGGAFLQPTEWLNISPEVRSVLVEEYVGRSFQIRARSCSAEGTCSVPSAPSYTIVFTGSTGSTEPDTGSTDSSDSANGAGYSMGLVSVSYVGGWSDVNSSDARRYISMDATGDGLTDVVEIFRSGPNSTSASVWRSTGDRFVFDGMSGIGAWSDVDASNARRYLTLDADGDGLTDIVEIHQSGPNETSASIWRSRRVDFVSGGTSVIGAWSDVDASNARRYLTLDADGDGLTDIVEIYQDGPDSTSALIWRSTGAGFELDGASGIGAWSDVDAPNARRYLPMDTDGDGYTDIVEIYQSGPTSTGASVWRSTGEGFEFESWSGIGGWSDVDAPNTRRYLPMDADGDGYTDIVEIYQSGPTSTSASVWHSSSEGFEFESSSWIGGWTDLDAPDVRRYLAADIDGDAVPEIIEIYKSGANSTNSSVWRLNGVNFDFVESRWIGAWSDVTSADARQYMAIDTDSDGACEVLEIYKQGLTGTGATLWSLGQ